MQVLVKYTGHCKVAQVNAKLHRSFRIGEQCYLNPRSLVSVSGPLCHSPHITVCEVLRGGLLKGCRQYLTMSESVRHILAERDIINGRQKQMFLSVQNLRFSFSENSKKFHTFN